MLFKLIGSNDLSKDDIKKLEANGFKIEFKKVDEEKEDYYNTWFRIIEHYNLFIDVNRLEDLILIYDLLQQELIITKHSDSKESYCLEVHNGYR